MTSKITILSIDDDKFIHKIIARTLNPKYETIFALTGEEGINLAKVHKPDIIITDVEMPGLNGYETCEKLKSDPVTCNTPVIFLSSLDSLQERLSGFEAGADDYLVKPFDTDELLGKLNTLTQYIEEQGKIQQKITEAEKTAYLALSGSSDLGMAMQLIENSSDARSIKEIAKSLLQYCKSKELKCSVLITTHNDPICITTEGVASPLEVDLMELLRAEQKRFHDFGCRTQINYPNISLLINNMPLGDSNSYGSIKDSFPPILAVFDTKIKSLNTEATIREQRISLNESFQEIKENLKKMGVSLHENAKSSFEIMNNMLTELNMDLPSMELEDDQEKLILDKIEKAVDSARKASDTGEDINSSFTTMINQLQNLVDKQNELLDSSVRLQKESEVDIDKKSMGGGSMDVELF